MDKNTLTSTLIYESTEEALEPYKERINATIPENPTIAELKKELNELQENTVVFLVIFNRDRNGEVVTLSEAMELVSENTDKPVYVLLNIPPLKGVVGGKLLDPVREGELTGELAIKVLNGEKPSDIPIIDYPDNRYVFNWEEMEKRSISEKDVPKGSIFYNKELSAYEENKKIILGTIGIILLQFFLIGTLIVNKIKLDQKKKSLDLEKIKAEESDKLKSNFLANMSHEIRTPMNAIIGFSELLKNTEVPIEKKDRYIDLIHSSGQNLVVIINDILDISRIEASELEIFKKEFDIDRSLDELYSVFSSRVAEEKKDVELILKKPHSNGPTFIYSDEGRIKQVITNYLGNALKFTDSGSIEFGYIWKKQDHTLYSEFYVKDTGIGIPEEDLATVFERFSQVDGEHSRQYKGTGLGLAISKSLVELMGGNIRVESEEGKGTTFYFTIPVE